MATHPDYPIDFKPAIARYDWDQTYDVLEFVHLPLGFDGLMQQLGIPAFELMAIDRYTPYNYLWAEEYSDYTYNFLKQFNFSPYADLTLQFTGYLGTTGTETKTTVLSKLNSLPRYNRLSSYPVGLSEGQYRATMLVYCHNQEGIIGNIPTINQTVVNFTLTETTDYDLNKLIKSVTENTNSRYGDISFIFCSNSLVIEKQINGLWQGITVTPTVPFLMYSDIVNYFGSVSSLIVAEFSNTYDSSKVIDLFDVLLKHLCPLQSFPQKLVDNFTAFPSSSNLEFTFQQFPDYIRNYCYLQRANNNKWGGNLYPDLGYIPSTHAPDTSFLPILYPVKPELITDSLGNAVFLNQDALFPIYELGFIEEYGRKANGNYFKRYSDGREFQNPTGMNMVGDINQVSRWNNAWVKWIAWNFARKITRAEYLISSEASLIFRGGLNNDVITGSTRRVFKERSQQHNIADGSYTAVLLRDEEITIQHPEIPAHIIPISQVVSLPTFEDTILFFDIQPYTLAEWGEIIAKTEIPESTYYNYLITQKTIKEAQ